MCIDDRPCWSVVTEHDLIPRFISFTSFDPNNGTNNYFFDCKPQNSGKC